MPSLRLISLFLAAPLALFAQNATDIVRRSVERDWTDFAALKHYTYQQRSAMRRYGKDGKLTSQESQTHEILILEGHRLERAIARDDKPLSAREARREQDKLDREVAKLQHESAAEKARWQKERARDRDFVRELPDAFVFRLTGAETVSGQPAWVIEADPKPGYRPSHPRAKIFAKARAKVWIDQTTYHWVKMDAQVLETLSFGLGLLRIAPGGTLHFEQVRVNDEVWLPSVVLVHANARLALLKTLRAEFESRYSGYRKFQSDSRIVTEEK